MSRARRLDPVESFIVGTIGQPGEREFYLQAKFHGGIHSFAIDKSQVTALADRMALLIGELKSADYRFENVIAVPLQVPLIPEFQVGVIGIIWLPESEQVLLELQELSEAELTEILPVSTEFEANNFISLARKVISAGRAPCPFCGLPINRDGHLCPRANGYRR
jgi:uncharacterized repeat protein (TIGR03847 family)